MADYKLPVITGTELSTGDLLRWGGSAWVNYADSAYQAQGAALDDLSALGAPSSDGQFIVATGAGAFAYDARDSLGLGTGDGPTFAGGIFTDDVIVATSAGSPKGLNFHFDGVAGNCSSRVFFNETGLMTYGISFLYAGGPNPTLGGTAFTLTENTFYIVQHNNSDVGNNVLSIARNTGYIGLGVDQGSEQIHASDTIRADTFFNHNGTDGITHSTAGAITTLTTAGGIVTAIARGGAAKFGDGGTSHYSEFEADGTLKFVGDATVFKDADVSVVSLLPVSGSEPGQFTFRDEAAGDTGIPTYSFSNDQAVTGSIEIPHDYKEGSNLVFHVHWQGTVAPTDTDNVQWQLTYTVGQTGATLDATATEVIETGFDTRYEFMRSDFPTITGTNYNIGDQFIFHLSRIAASANEYGGGARAATVGFHYECDTAGSRTIVAK